MLRPVTLLTFLVAALPLIIHAAPGDDRVVIDLTGSGWRLWHDARAEWANDPLHFPAPAPESLPVNPPTAGWEALNGPDSVAVSVPGTVEEYLQRVTGPDGDLKGVSWWSRSVVIPAASTRRTLLLRFESVRHRAEVFVNRKLAGYDLVGNSPFEVDLSRFAQPGERCEIAVRVTDPGGNFDWRDSSAMRWGQYALPMSHGFGGITGRVQLVACDPVHVDDIYVQNTPAITTANAIVTVQNRTSEAIARRVTVRVAAKDDPSAVVFATTLPGRTFVPGANEFTVKIDAPDARRWELDDPRLYVCTIALADEDGPRDHARQTFGFRWFGLDGIGENAVLRLNGRRIVLRTAISWGFWPINGIYPTEALAEKQIRIAKEMGLNMLNFHRAIGNPVVLEQADRLGLLYYQEPGAYKSVTGDPFGRSLAREKWLRLVRRDRSHPSLVIYNLINEWNSRNPNPDPREIARHREDMAAARELDPSRIITHTSAWSRGKDIEDPSKLHFRPFDATPYSTGWYDVHHAGGPATWNESLYRDPDDFYLRTDNTREVVFWGEEGAISTPPRLGSIKRAIESGRHLGWDGGMYLEWHDTFATFMDRKGLRAGFGDVDGLTTAMGAVSLGHQGRRIENVRMSDVGDGYAVNGWEAEIVENHSGIVDCFRHAKGDPAILAYYNQPLYVAVKLRTTVVHVGDALVLDAFIVNEQNVRGPHRLAFLVRDENGRTVAATEREVQVSGGDRYGERLVAEVRVPLPGATAGAYRVEARLLDTTGNEIARGRDHAVLVSWRGEPIRGRGAVWESQNDVLPFLTGAGATASAYTRALPRLDWIVVARGPREGEPTAIPGSQVTTPSGQRGWRTTFHDDHGFSAPIHERVDATLRYSVDDGASPDPALAVMTNYGVRWEANLSPVRGGTHAFVVRASGGIRLLVDGKTVVDAPPARNAQTVRGTATLDSGRPVSVVVELRQVRGVAACELSWIPPEEDPLVAASLLDRVARDGTTLVILERADSWLPLLTGAANPGVTFRGSFKVGKTWLGGIHFVKRHPLFAGLPTDVAMDWPYQAVVRNGDERTGLQLEGEDFAAGCYHSFPMQLGTAVGVIRFGQGRVVFSTLDIASQVNAAEGPAHVARKLLLNYVNFEAGRE